MALRKQTQLRELRLDYCSKITDEGVAQLVGKFSKSAVKGPSDPQKAKTGTICSTFTSQFHIIVPVKRDGIELHLKLF